MSAVLEGDVKRKTNNTTEKQSNIFICNLLTCFTTGFYVSVTLSSFEAVGQMLLNSVAQMADK